MVKRREPVAIAVPILLFISVISVALALSGCGSEKSVAPLQDNLEVPARNVDLLGVTNAYGPLVVKPGTYLAEAKTKPWTSWWYPLADEYMFEGRNHGTTGAYIPSPLEKYDMYVSRWTGVEGKAASYERSRRRGFYDTWEGLCNAWAAASVLEPEPAGAARIDGISFSVGDLKALLVKSYERSNGLTTYGQRYDGQADSVYEDIYPDQFHRLVQAELFGKGRPVIIDNDPGIEVWNYPIWKAQTKIRADASDPRRLKVSTFIIQVQPLSQPVERSPGDPYDFTDFLGANTVAHEYTYDLYGYPQPDGSLKVEYGVWTGHSVKDHPDYARAVNEVELPAEHESVNKELNTLFISEILEKASAIIGGK